MVLGMSSLNCILGTVLVLRAVYIWEQFCTSRIEQRWYVLSMLWWGSCALSYSRVLGQGFGCWVGPFLCVGPSCPGLLPLAVPRLTPWTTATIHTNGSSVPSMRGQTGHLANRNGRVRLEKVLIKQEGLGA